MEFPIFRYCPHVLAVTVIQRRDASILFHGRLSASRPSRLDVFEGWHFVEFCLWAEGLRVFEGNYDDDDNDHDKNEGNVTEVPFTQEAGHDAQRDASK